jgi:hypothetical protein
METHPVTTLELMSYAVNDCGDADRNRIGRHAETCPACASRLKAIAAECADFLARFPYAAVLGGHGGSEVVRKAPYPPLYALAAGLLVAVTAGWFAMQHITGATARIKGDVSIAVYVKAADGKIEQRADNRYHPGEQIQIAYSTGEADRLILVSVDDSGHMTTYYPATGDTSIAIEKGRGLPLPNSIILDSYIGHELLVAVFSASALHLSDVKARIVAAQRASGDLSALRLSAPDTWTVRTVLITKTER